MNKTNIIVGGTKGASKLVRAKFGPGMLLQHEDLERLNTYTRELSRLMFKSLFGCGVICGLVVKTTLKCGKVEVTVGAGVALGCSGDPVYVPKDQTFPLDENCDPDIGGPLWVVLCGTVKCCAPRASICSCDDDDAPTVCTQERDAFEIRVVRELPYCICGCTKPEDLDHAPQDETKCLCVDPNLKCYEDHYLGKCGCNCDECSDCDCKCILLSRLDKIKDTDEWSVDHRVRRFIRPILMRDPQVEAEEKAKKETKGQQQKAAEEKKQVEERLLKASEEKNQVEAQLLKMAEEKKQVEERLLKMAEEKKQVEEQLLKVAEEKRQKVVQRKTPKSQ